MENSLTNSPILIVDDDEGLLFSIRAALLSAGLPDPTMVSDSRKVLDLVRKHKFHLAQCIERARILYHAIGETGFIYRTPIYFGWINRVRGS